MIKFNVHKTCLTQPDKLVSLIDSFEILYSSLIAFLIFYRFFSCDLLNHALLILDFCSHEGAKVGFCPAGTRPSLSSLVASPCHCCCCCPVRYSYILLWYIRLHVRTKKGASTRVMSAMIHTCEIFDDSSPLTPIFIAYSILCFT